MTKHSDRYGSAYDTDPCSITRKNPRQIVGHVPAARARTAEPHCAGRALSGKPCRQRSLRIETVRPRQGAGRPLLLAVVLLAISAAPMALSAPPAPEHRRVPASVAATPPLSAALSGSARAAPVIRHLAEAPSDRDTRRGAPQPVSTMEKKSHPASADTRKGFFNARQRPEERNRGKRSSEGNPVTPRAALASSAEVDPWWVYRALERSSRILDVDR